MTDYSNSDMQRTCEYLESVGIDPGLVAGDESFTTASYWTVVRDEHGQFVMDPESPDHTDYLTEEQQWPSLAIAIKAVGLFIEEQRIKREGGDSVVRPFPER